ncbi:MAG: peptide ABC transporter substrate-binding protein [Ruthenibacterium sp.]
MRKLLALSLACALAFSLVACGTPSASGGTSAEPGEATYRKLYSSEVSTINYLVTNTQMEQQVGANVIDCLVEYDAAGKLMPALAESWTVSEDNLTYTFKIRKGVKWVDNTGAEVADVTAKDFVSAAQYVLDANHESGTAASYFGVVANAEEYYNYTSYLLTSENGAKTTDADGNAIEPAAEIAFDAVGVKALDDDTLEYTLAAPTPYFLSALTYVCFMPVYEPFLTEQGDAFGTDAATMLYCGAYYLSDFAPQQTRVFTKNPSYWDKDKVFITTIEETYNAESGTIGPEMAKRGEIDQADISSDLLDSWLSNDETKDIVSKYRNKVDYSYFYCFNFDPNFDAEYEPDNWKIVVNNENFRQSMMAALDRVKELAVLDQNDPQSLVINTITPPNFAAADGKDYAQFDAVKSITEGDSFQKDKAISYKEKAMQELTAAGATFPVKILMPYNPTIVDWDKECMVVEQQMEGLLGADYIDIIVQAGPETGFLTEVRRSGNYAFMKCGWGADYADPQTWTDPFYGDYKYAFLEKGTGDTAKVVAEYRKLVEAGMAQTSDMTVRYDAFAKAEAYLIQHALTIPFSTAGVSYQVSKLNVFESQYAPFGVSGLRYKGQHLYDVPLSMAQYEENLAAWEALRA